MTNDHILLKLSKTALRVEEDLDPPGCDYDLLVGAWVIRDSGELLANSPLRRGPRTKKFDIETGEDQKGE